MRNTWAPTLFRCTAIALTVAALGGCAANYPLAESNPEQSMVKVPGNAESTYRTILGFSKEFCYKLTTDAQYYPAAKEGEITLMVLANGGKIKTTFMSFDIKQDEAESAVTITIRKGLHDLRDAGLSWAKGIAAPCPFPF